MRIKTCIFLLLMTASVLIGASNAWAITSVAYPSVSLNFDPATFTYTYTVQCPANSAYPFGEFQVDTKLAWNSSWQISGPWVPVKPTGTNYNWTQGFSKISTTSVTHYAYWKANETAQIPENTAWTGQFILVVPNSRPTPGTVLTKDGLPGSLNVLNMDVPGPVPEPQSLLVLGTGLASLAGFWVRRR